MIIYDTINQFVDRVRAASRAKSKEVRVAIAEAEDVALAIAQMTAREANLQQQIIDLQNQLINLQNTIGMNNFVVNADGGSLK